MVYLKLCIPPLPRKKQNLNDVTGIAYTTRESRYWLLISFMGFMINSGGCARGHQGTVPCTWAYISDNGRVYFPEENNGRAAVQRWRRRWVIGGQNGRTFAVCCSTTATAVGVVVSFDRGWWLTSSRPLLSGTTAGPGGQRNAIKFGRGIASRRPRAENRLWLWLEQPTTGRSARAKVAPSVARYNFRRRTQTVNRPQSQRHRTRVYHSACPERNQD